MASFVETNRGGKKLHFNGYIYMKIRGSSTSDLCFWRCEQHRQGCEARATLEGSSVVVRKEHNHPPNPAGITTQEAIANTRKRAREENTPINTIYDDQLVEISMEDHADDALSQLPSLESLRSTLYRARHETIPHLPTSRRDVEFPDRFTKTLSGSEFLFVNDGDDDKIVIFTTDENLRLMSEAQEFYMDGTFSTCPAVFAQVFTVHIILYGHTFPMAYCLLPGKQRQTYNRTFLHLKDVALVLGYTLDPFVTISDFEISMIQAATINFPNAHHQSCYYHFMQAIWRKVQALGLANEYSCHNSLLKPFVQRMAALAFIPSTFVRPAWLAIQQTAPTTIPRVDDLVEYFTDTWLNGSFPQSQWNYFNQHLPRTNNHVEGWHSKIAKIIIQISTLGSSSFNGKKR